MFIITTILACKIPEVFGLFGESAAMRFEVRVARSGVRNRTPPRFCVPMGIKPQYANVSISWGDGIVTNISSLDYASGSVTYCNPTVFLSAIKGVVHDYAVAGVYNITISPLGPGPVWLDSFGSGNGDDYSPYSRILRLFSWGELGLSNLDGAFRDSIELTTVPDQLPPSITSTARLFSSCRLFNQNISSWNVSTVTNMKAMFLTAAAFNQSLEQWDVSQVTDMSFVFSYAASFNSSLSTWNVTKVRDMSYMFASATRFNQPLDSWDVSRVTSMANMFAGAVAFNQSLDRWDVSNVQLFNGTFDGALAFDQPLDTWDTSNCTTMRQMFRYSAFNRPLYSWNTSRVTDMSGMFGYSNFNQPLASWDTSKVTDISEMFLGSNFNQAINSWNTSSVRLLYGMFADAKKFNQPLDAWDVSKVLFAARVFRGAVSFNQSLASWRMLPVDIFEIFSGATSFNQLVESWNVSLVNDFRGVFSGATSFNQSLKSWDVGGGRYFDSMFESAISFDQDISNWNMSSASSAFSMFSNATSFAHSLRAWSSTIGGLSMVDKMFLGAINYYDDLSSWHLCNLLFIPASFADASKVIFPLACAPSVVPATPSAAPYIPPSPSSSAVVPTILVFVISLWPIIAGLPCLSRRHPQGFYSPLPEDVNLDVLIHRAAHFSAEDKQQQLPAEVWQSILNKVKARHAYRLMMTNSQWLRVTRVWPEKEKLHLLKQTVEYGRNVLQSTSVPELFKLSNFELDTHLLADSSRRSRRRALRYVKSSTLVMDLLRRVERRATTYQTFSLKGSFAAILLTTMCSIVGFFLSLATVIILFGSLNSLYAAICAVQFIVLPISTLLFRLVRFRFWVPSAVHVVFATEGLCSALLLEQGTTSDYHSMAIAIITFCVVDTICFSLPVLAASADRLGSQLDEVRSTIMSIRASV
eukprot:TRINITY_DN4976_c0_g1_i1.p1 TRINITY_DN4976_c0_g1~~TRINITY_DN4976_c0_g1_i1.p1  ORF type:complete len:923 (-),score=88.24 TRINITY_DN4976_c0_g1_i1:2021-4789(-)